MGKRFPSGVIPLTIWNYTSHAFRLIVLLFGNLFFTPELASVHCLPCKGFCFGPRSPEKMVATVYPQTAKGNFENSQGRTFNTESVIRVYFNITVNLLGMFEKHRYLGPLSWRCCRSLIETNLWTMMQKLQESSVSDTK